MTDIIGLIDGAIADWTTSGDAMRWTHEERAGQFVPHTNHPCAIMPVTSGPEVAPPRTPTHPTQTLHT